MNSPAQPLLDLRWVRAALRDARRRTLQCVEDLSDEQLRVPRLSIVNPLLWELGHVAWFQERWMLRRDRTNARMDRDALYDSSRVAHGTRWDLPLLDRSRTLGYLGEVLEETLSVLERPRATEDAYFATLALFHEDMHGEALIMTRQTLGYRSPFEPMRAAPTRSRNPGDVALPGGTIRIGAEKGRGAFIFDNEKWAHDVELAPFAISRDCVTQGEFAAFVQDGGYRQRELWSQAGWAWRERVRAELPVYWRREGTGWSRRHFDSWLPLEPDLPMVHVCWFEADAYCRWAGRRLPSEAEWELAAQPWAEREATRERANLDGDAGGCVPVQALEEGDSASGCRQMLGNVWEWTAHDFLPFEGFSADPYEDYSQPWFGSHKVLKGGAWMTRSRMIRPGFRNFYTPDRRDVFAGFRTCAR